MTDGVFVNSSGTIVAQVFGQTGTSVPSGQTFIAIGNPGVLQIGHAPPNPLVGQAQTALTQGITITSTANGAALNGVYACDAVTTAQIFAVSQYITVNTAFPAGLSSLPWPDAAGNKHTFSTVTEFQAFASAVASYVTQLNMIINGVSSATSLPTAAATIP